METKYCIKCGNKIPVDAEFCPNCGAHQDDYNDKKSATGITYSTNSYGKNSNQSNNTKNDINYSSNRVTLSEAFKLFFKNYSNFGGTSSPSEFWMMYLIQIISMLLWIFLINLGDAPSISSSGFAVFSILVILNFLWGIVSIIPSLSLTARRMRDAGTPNGYIVALMIGNCIPFIDIVTGIISLVIFLKPSKR